MSLDGEPAGYVVQLFGHVLADSLEREATAAAQAGSRLRRRARPTTARPPASIKATVAGSGTAITVPRVANGKSKVSSEPPSVFVK